MRTKLFHLIVFLWISHPLAAQQSADVHFTADTKDVERLTLQQCMDRACQGNLSLQAARKGTERAQTLQGTAWDLGKTELTLGQDPTSGASPDNALTLSQTMDFPTVYVARRRQLKAETRVAEGEADVLRNEVRSRVASLYCQLLYQNERIRILQRQNSLLQAYAVMAQKRHEAGDVRQVEPLSARRMLQDNLLETDMAKAECTNLQATLSRLTGATGTIQPADTTLAPIDGAANGGFSYAQTPDGQLARARLAVADEAVKVAKSDYAPSLSLALRTQMVIKGWNPYHVDRSWNNGNFMGFEVGVGLPLFSGSTRAKVKAAKKEREITQLQIDSQTQELQEAYTAAVNSMVVAKRRMEYYVSSGNADAAEISRLSALDYASGEIGYVEYVDALEKDIDAQLKRAAAINDYNQAVVALKKLQGM